MKLRNRIIISFSTAFLIVFGVALVGVYYLMAINREVEFIQRLKDKTTTTYRLLLDVKEIDHDVMVALDHNTINSLYDEKILLFDSAGRNIYSSVDDTRILFPLETISALRNGDDDVIYREGDYEVYAHIIHDKGKTFFAIGKAYDKYGKSKLAFLGWSLFIIYILVLIIVIIICFYLSRLITRPIVRLTEEVNSRSINNLTRVDIPPTHDEITLLASGFNEMLARVEQAYMYQKNFIQHVSHELKTPIAVMISNLERAMADTTQEKWKESFDFQKSGLMQMASIINTLLDISKYETSPESLLMQDIRMDEIVFESFESVQQVYPDARLNLNIHDNLSDADDLTGYGNERMMNIALFNLLKNAVEYSNDSTVDVEIEKHPTGIRLDVINNGQALSPEEQRRLFENFFRGENSRSKAGIGLGLVMASKIIRLHRGTLTYSSANADQNCFSILLPVH